MSVRAADTSNVKQRRLFVAWRHPATGAIEPVAALIQVGVPNRQAAYIFYYLRRVKTLDDFGPFVAFPDISKVYRGNRLFPFFANRLWPRKRDDYGRMMDILDLSIEADPFEVLARSGGHRATDQIEVFPEPERDEITDTGKCLFFLRGLRHFPNSEEAASGLDVNERLWPLLDIQNPVNPQAIRLADTKNQTLGYVPDYLASYVHEMLERCPQESVRFTVEHVNTDDTPRHMRVLCRLTACWPENYQPFAGTDYLPLGDEADVAGLLAGAGWWSGEPDMIQGLSASKPQS